MIRISDEAWQVMVRHAEEQYPNECCGALVGRTQNEDGGLVKVIHRAIPVENAYDGAQADRYEIRPEDLLRVDREARKEQSDLLGIYHSHPDCDAYFSKTDLENSCPWYSFVVLSVKAGRVDHANSFLPNADQTHAEPEALEIPAIAGAAEQAGA